MRRSLSSWLEITVWAAVLGALTASTLVADERRDSANQGKPAAATEVTLRGRVVKVAAETRQVVIQTAAGREVTLHTSDASKVRLNNADAKLADLSVGTEVLVTLKSQDGKNLVSSITSAPASGLGEKDRNPPE